MAAYNQNYNQQFFEVNITSMIITSNAIWKLIPFLDHNVCDAGYPAVRSYLVHLYSAREDDVKSTDMATKNFNVQKAKEVNDLNTSRDFLYIFTKRAKAQSQEFHDW